MQGVCALPTFAPLLINKGTVLTFWTVLKVWTVLMVSILQKNVITARRGLVLC